MADPAPSLANSVRSRLRFRHLELVVMLADTSNIHEAARRLHMSQSAASKLLKETESLYGSALFVRLAKGVRPTAVGEAVIRWSRLNIRNVSESVAEASLIAQGGVGSVRVGFLPAAPALLSEVLIRIRESHPGLRVTAMEGSNNFLLSALARAEFDVVLGRLIPAAHAPDFTSEVLYREAVSLVVRTRHPLLRKRKLTADDFRNLAWAHQPEFEPFRMQLTQELEVHLRNQGDAQVVTTSPLLIQMMLSRSDMVAVLPSTLADMLARQGLLAVLPVGIPVEVPPLGLIRNAALAPSPAVQAFMAAVRATVGDELHRIPAS